MNQTLFKQLQPALQHAIASGKIEFLHTLSLFQHILYIALGFEIVGSRSDGLIGHG